MLLAECTYVRIQAHLDEEREDSSKDSVSGDEAGTDGDASSDSEP